MYLYTVNINKTCSICACEMWSEMDGWFRSALYHTIVVERELSLKLSIYQTLYIRAATCGHEHV